MTATREQIVRHFLNTLWKRKWTEMATFNWGLHDRANHGIWAAEYDDEFGSPIGDRLGYWDVDDDTYINGIPLIIDYDYMGGYLLEIFERDSEAVSYVVISINHGFHPETGEIDHDSNWLDGDAGRIGDRKIDTRDVVTWAAGSIHDLVTAREEGTG